jgi:molybdenum cofactor biosynthesis enzyme MoaA
MLGLGAIFRGKQNSAPDTPSAARAEASVENGRGPGGVRDGIDPVMSAAPRAIWPRSYQGCLEQRSTRHVAGWIVNPASPLEHPELEVIVANRRVEIIVARGRADRDARWLQTAPPDGAAHGFHLVLPNSISEAERDHLIVRPVGGGHPIPNAAVQQTRYRPIRHVALDVVDNCNLRCPFCVYDYSNTHRTHLMSVEIFDAAIRLMPYVGVGHFWLSCLHEPTMHPRFANLIERVPWEYRSNIFFTTNLSRRMPQEYYDVLGRSGLDFINVSIESRDPVIYERMREGARHSTFMNNWEQLLAACRSGSAPPKLHYIIMAYKSNLTEIPGLVGHLRDERRASFVDIRHTFDMQHISKEFKQAEFLNYREWRWLQSQLAQYPTHEVHLSLPRWVASTVDSDPTNSDVVPMQSRPPVTLPTILPGEFEFRVSYDGTVCVSPIYSTDRPDVIPDLAQSNILDIHDPVEFLLAVDSKVASMCQNSES